MSLHLLAKSLCTIHLVLDKETRTALTARHHLNHMPTHIFVGVALHQHHQIKDRALSLQHTCHVVTLGIYQHEAPENVYILSERYASRLVATQISMRTEIPSPLISRAPMKLDMRDDDTSQTIAFHYDRLDPMHLTATYPRYERQDVHDPLLHASARHYLTPGETPHRVAQQCEPVTSWTVQSHRASHLARALWAEELGSCQAKTHVVHVHHAPHIHLSTSPAP